MQAAGLALPMKLSTLLASSLMHGMCPVFSRVQFARVSWADCCVCSVPEELPEAVHQLMVECMDADAVTRPSAREIFDRLTAIHPLDAVN